MPKHDRNGYAPSLFNTEDGECYICKSQRQTIRHEVLFGVDRQNSKHYGLWINICPEPLCHSFIHRDSNGEYLYLKEQAQRLFEQAYGHRQYMAIFGKNYLEEDEWTEHKP